MYLSTSVGFVGPGHLKNGCESYPREVSLRNIQVLNLLGEKDLLG